MLEIHLFVNPLGMQCYRCEQDVLRIDKDLQQTKLQYQFVPLINMHTIQNTLHRYGLSASHHQAVSELLYQVSLDYKAALFQGGKRGRHYLLQLQTAIIKNARRYSPALVEEIARQVGLDLEMFLADRQSDLAREAFVADQKMANELGVTRTATAVIFDTTGPDYGVLINDFDYDTLIQLLHDGQLQVMQTAQDFIDRFNHVQPRFRIL